jgi:alanine racemase
MTLTLTVDAGAFETHVRSALGAGVVPVVKGNGYGFGRATLAALAVERFGATTLCVGTVHELAGLPAGARRVVLTPALGADVALAAPGDLLTVGDPGHVHALGAAGWSSPVLVKLRSSMRRYGAGPDHLATLLAAVDAAGLAVAGASLHLPLSGDDADRRAEVETWLPQLPASVDVWVSHLSPAAFAALRDAHPERRWYLRLGTALWLGDKSFTHLGAEVVQVQPVTTGQTAGYRAAPVPGDGYLVMVGAGTAHGVHPLPDGRSPFHHARRRLPLLEPPHMHTSVVWVAAGEAVPSVGDVVDVQQPLTYVSPDRVMWGSLT